MKTRVFTKTALWAACACVMAFLLSPVEVQAATRLNGKKVIFIGNSFVYYGGCTSKGSRRQEDSGQFKRLCELNGDNVTVTDCTYGNHSLSDFTASGCVNGHTSGTGCLGKGKDLLGGLDLSSYDIVFISEAGSNPSKFWNNFRAVQKRFTKPGVEFYYLSHTYTYINNHYYIVNNFDNFEDIGVQVLEWGRICTELYNGNKAPGNMTPERKGKLTIPNSKVTYKKNSFIKNKNDQHHPNPLSGYITALMAYCAASGTLAQGMPYDFINDVININSFISSHYTSSTATNMKEILASEADMQGLQALMDICIQHGIFDYDVKSNGMYFKVDDAARVTCERYTRLTGDLVIPDTVLYNSTNYATKEITPYAFYAHSGLNSIVIPATVEKVGNHAFQGTDALKQVTCKALVPPTMPDDAFTTYTTTTLMVPTGTKALYAAAEGWRNFTNIVEDPTTSAPSLGDDYLRADHASISLRGKAHAQPQPYLDIVITGNDLTTDISFNPTMQVVRATPLDGWDTKKGGTLRITLDTDYQYGVGTYTGYLAVQSTSAHRIEIPFTAVITEQTIDYTVQYNANGGSGTMAATQHTQGVTSAVSANKFTRSGYSFGGWYVHRQSDDKWVYFESDGAYTPGWHNKGDQPVGAFLATYADKHQFTDATSVNGDVITLYAFWQPNTTSTPSFYVRYDANGGTGTMGETKVTYGTAKTTASNVFIREGYTWVGWTPFRIHGGDNEWCYKKSGLSGDDWLNGPIDSLILKTYPNAAGVAKTSSVNADVITFYAAWARVKDGIDPVNIKQGTQFDLSGKITCTTDMYATIVRIKDQNGNVLQTCTRETHSSRTTLNYHDGYELDQFNDSIIDFSTLAVGDYIYEVAIQTFEGGTPDEYVIHSVPFEVTKEGLLTDVVAMMDNTPLQIYFDGAHIRVNRQAQTMEVYTLAGQSIKMARNTNSMSVDQWSEGVYIVVVTNKENERYTQKIVIH